MSERPVPTTFFHESICAGAGGLCGAFLAHILVTLSLRAGGELWLKGPYGPGHFFGTALYSGILYGAIGLGLSRKPKPAVVGLLGAFLGIALPMAVLTRTTYILTKLTGLLLHSPRLTGQLLGWWPELSGVDNPVIALAWTLAVIAAFLLGTWGTTLALGALLCPGRRLRGALFAVLGSLAGYLVLELFLRLVPSYAQGRWAPMSFIPSPLDLLTGLLIGAGMGAGIYLAGRRFHNEVIPDEKSIPA